MASDCNVKHINDLIWSYEHMDKPLIMTLRLDIDCNMTAEQLGLYT